MTVAALPSVASYIENGVTIAFAVPFRFKAAGDLVVERVADGVAVPLQLDIDYTVAGGTTDAGGTLTRTAATAGATLRIRRRTARAQPMVYTTGDRFPAQSHEDALDRAILITQELDATAADLTTRGLFAGAGETIGDLPAANLRPGKALGFGADPYQPLMITPGGADGALRTDLAAQSGAQLTGYRSVASAPAGTVKQRLDQLDFIPAFGVVPWLAGATIVDQAPAINLAYAAAALVSKNLMLPEGDIYIGSPIKVLEKTGLVGHGQDQTRLRHMTGVTTPMFNLDAGAITFGYLRDFGCFGNELAGEDLFGFIAQAEPVGYPHGGLWQFTFDRIRAQDFGGVTLKLWGGANGLLPMQFLTIRDCTFYRAATATSRCVSLAAQCGQVFFEGNNQFDAVGLVTAGTNVVIGSLYFNSTLGKYGDSADALNAAGGTATGWAAVASPSGNNQGYAVHLNGTSIQSGYRGLLLDNARACSWEHGYIENTVQAITAFRSIVTLHGKFNNAGGGVPNAPGDGSTGFTSDTFGHIVGVGGDAVVTVKAGTSIGGRTDASFITLSGAPAIVVELGVEMPGVDLYALPSSIMHQAAPVAGVLDLGRAQHWLVGSGTGAENVTSLDGKHPPGTLVTITAASGTVLQFLNASNPAHAGGDIRLRYRDALIISRDDLGSYWHIVGQSIAELVAAAIPTAGYFVAGEFVRNTGTAAYTPASGKLLLGWARKTTGTAHAAGTDWEPVYATNS